MEDLRVDRKPFVKFDAKPVSEVITISTDDDDDGDGENGEERNDKRKAKRKRTDCKDDIWWEVKRFKEKVHVPDIITVSSDEGE